MTEHETVDASDLKRGDRIGAGLLTIAFVRMEALKQAIQDREWERVEWEYDRVLRALAKLERESSPA